MRKLLISLASVVFIFGAFFPAVVLAGDDPKSVFDQQVRIGEERGTLKCTNAFSCSLKELKSFASGSGVDVKQTPETIAGNIINTAIGLLGVVAVALIVYAGGLWITAAGNDDKVEKAKGIIKTTVIGMVVVGLAYAITLFVVSFVTG